MSSNSNITISNKPECVRIKTHAELTEELEIRQNLRIQYQCVRSPTVVLTLALDLPVPEIRSLVSFAFLDPQCLQPL